MNVLRLSVQEIDGAWCLIVGGEIENPMDAKRIHDAAHGHGACQPNPDVPEGDKLNLWLECLGERDPHLYTFKELSTLIRAHLQADPSPEEPPSASA